MATQASPARRVDRAPFDPRMMIDLRDQHHEATMRAYVLTTGTIFGLITVAHVWRVVSESRTLARDPFFVLLTLASAGFSFWALRLARSPARP